MTEREVPGRIAVVVVNYRVGDLTVDCLRSVLDENRDCEISVIVVDNDSRDGSAQDIEAAIEKWGWGDRVTFLPITENRGFAAGNNLAIRHLLAVSDEEKPEYILPLNPDTIVRPGAIQKLAEFLGHHPEA